MLKTNPEVGQFIEVLLSDVYEDTQLQYQTKGDIHEVVGISDISGCPYFIGDSGEPVYIDDSAYHLYKIHDSNSKFKVYLAHSISTTGEFNDSIRVAERLESIGMEVYAPARNKAINDKSNAPTPKMIYDQDVENLLNADIVVVNYGGGDGDGTVLELGILCGMAESNHPMLPKVFVYSSNKRALQPQLHNGVASGKLNHMVLGGIDVHFEWVGSEEEMIVKVAKL